MVDRSWNFRRGGIHWENMRPQGSLGSYRGELNDRAFRVVIGGGTLSLEYPIGSTIHVEPYRTAKEASKRTPKMVREVLRSHDQAG